MLELSAMNAQNDKTVINESTEFLKQEIKGKVRILFYTKVLKL